MFLCFFLCFWDVFGKLVSQLWARKSQQSLTVWPGMQASTWQCASHTFDVSIWPLQLQTPVGREPGRPPTTNHVHKAMPYIVIHITYRPPAWAYMLIPTVCCNVALNLHEGLLKGNACRAGEHMKESGNVGRQCGGRGAGDKSHCGAVGELRARGGKMGAAKRGRAGRRQRPGSGGREWKEAGEWMAGDKAQRWGRWCSRDAAL